MPWNSGRRITYLSRGSFLCATPYLLLAVALSASSQTGSFPKPSDHLPRFEVATIKPVDPHRMIQQGIDVDPGGRVRLNGFSLKMMACAAFDLRYWQIEGGEEWMDKTLYNVVGQPPEDVRQRRPDTRHTLFGIEDPQLRQMVEALLLDRFQLKFHRETRAGKVYFLERTGKTLALRPSNEAPATEDAAADTFGSIGFAGDWVLDRTTMPQLARFASDFVMHAPVLDQTQLSGAFDYRGPPEDTKTYWSDPNGSFIRMIEGVGLKLESGKGPVEFLVLEQAETPSPN